MYQRSASKNTVLGLLLALVPGQFENRRKGLECTVCTWAYFPGILGALDNTVLPPCAMTSDMCILLCI